MRTFKILTFVVFATLAVSCGSKSKKQTSETTSSKASTIASNTLHLGNASFSIPSGWQKTAPTSRMRIAEVNISESPKVVLAIFHFGQQDMVQSNIDRWKGQFTQIEEYEELSLIKKDITALKILGTYKKKAFPMAQDFTETPDFGTLAAIAPSSNGPFYLKITGPKDVLEQEQAKFIEMLNSYTTK